MHKVKRPDRLVDVVADTRPDPFSFRSGKYTERRCGGITFMADLYDGCWTQRRAVERARLIGGCRRGAGNGGRGDPGDTRAHARAVDPGAGAISRCDHSGRRSPANTFRRATLDRARRCLLVAAFRSSSLRHRVACHLARPGRRACRPGYRHAAPASSSRVRLAGLPATGLSGSASSIPFALAHGGAKVN